MFTEIVYAWKLNEIFVKRFTISAYILVNPSSVYGNFICLDIRYVHFLGCCLKYETVFSHIKETKKLP